MQRTILTAFAVLAMGQVLSFSSCVDSPWTSEHDRQGEYFRVEVIGESMDCNGEWLVRFTADPDRVASITNTRSDIFVAGQLPGSCREIGRMIEIMFRNPTEDEIPVCTTFGPAYPHIVVTDSR